MNLIESLYAYPCRGVVALITGVLFFYFSFVLFPLVTKRYETRKSLMPRLQKAYRADNFKAILQDWSGKDERAAAIYKWDNLISLDLLFPLVYACFLAFAYASARGHERPLRWWDYLFFVAPFVVALLDYVENGLHLYLLRGVDTRAQVDAANFSAPLVLFASALSYVKALSIAVGIFAWLAALIHRWFR